MDRHWAPPGPAAGAATLLHGICSTSGTWWRVGPALAAATGFEVDALDLPGHGDATPPGEPLTLASLADDLARRIAPRPGGGLLVGHSLGAVAALGLAARHPHLVRALVLEDPPGGHPVGGDWLADHLIEDTTAARADRAAIERREQAANPTWAGQDVRHSVDGIVQLDLPWVTAGVRANFDWDLVELVAGAGLPVLLVVAPENPVRGVGSALGGGDRARIAELVGPERFVVMDGGHCLHRDHPDAWVATVAGFARGLWTPVDT
jgi:pimeloyl-ACP methyl ester carboxylesterase